MTVHKAKHSPRSWWEGWQVLWGVRSREVAGKTQPPGDPWGTHPWCPRSTILANSEPSLSLIRQINH